MEMFAVLSHLLRHPALQHFHRCQRYDHHHPHHRQISVYLPAQSTPVPTPWPPLCSRIPRQLSLAAPQDLHQLGCHLLSALNNQQQVSSFLSLLFLNCNYYSNNQGDCQAEDRLMMPTINISDLSKAFPWVLYVVLAELFMR